MMLSRIVESFTGAAHITAFASWRSSLPDCRVARLPGCPPWWLCCFVAGVPSGNLAQAHAAQRMLGRSPQKNARLALTVELDRNRRWRHHPNISNYVAGGWRTASAGQLSPQQQMNTVIEQAALAASCSQADCPKENQQRGLLRAQRAAWSYGSAQRVSMFSWR